MFRSPIYPFAFALVFAGAVILPKKLRAQNSRDVEVRQVPEQPKERTPQKKLSKKQARKQLNKSYAHYFDRLIKEYEDRMEANVKNRVKLAKALRKPQYSDPAYFGHKRRPKKRPNGKKKMCKECHMRH